MERNKRIVLLAVVALIVAAVLIYKSASQEPRTAVEEKTKTGQALLEQARGEPVWLLFRSSSCYPCIEMQKTMDALKPEFAGKIKFITVDVNDPANQALIEEYRIQYIPTTFLYDGKHRLVDQHVGALGAAEMRAKLNALLEEQK